MRFTTAALISGLAAIASAQTTPASGNPSGNPIIHPGLNELIPAGSPYTITWTPTTPGNISLILLRGPSTNVVPLLTIVNSTENTGSYTWSVPSTLQPDTTHYGVELIVQGTGQYQYSPQCGVSNSAVSSSNASTTATLVPATSKASNSTFWTSATGGANYSIPVITPTNSLTVPSSLISTSTSVASLSNSVVPSATATFQASPAASAVSTGAAVANVAKNLGAMAIAGVVGAWAL